MTPTAILGRLIGLYQTAIFVYALLSWFAPGTRGPLATVYRLLQTICEPFVGLFRRILPAAIVSGAGVDLAPLAAILVLIVVQRLLYGL